MTNASSIGDIYKAQQAFFESGATLSYAFRKTQLRRLKQGIKKHENAILDALHKDMHKHPVEAYGSEVGFLYTEIDHVLGNLARWMRPHEVTSPLEHYPSHSNDHTSLPWDLP